MKKVPPILGAVLFGSLIWLNVASDVPPAMAAAPAITVHCTQTSALCKTNLKRSFEAQGCTVTKVWCTGRPPPPGGTTGDYTCSIESPNCSPVPAGGCGRGTQPISASGGSGCRLVADNCCRSGNQCVCTRPVLDSDCTSPQNHVRVNGRTTATPEGVDYCVTPNDSQPVAIRCEARPPGGQAANPVPMPRPAGGVAAPGRTGNTDYCEWRFDTCPSTTPACPAGL